jgi:Flp pilus assembly pilin Flp
LSARTLPPRALARQDRRRRLRDDTGAATAEYAVVTVAAAGLGGILLKLLTSDWFIEIIKTILGWLVHAFLSLFGLG